MRDITKLASFIILLLTAATPIISANSSLQNEATIYSIGTVQYENYGLNVIWEDGFEDGDNNFPNWDDYYSDGTSPSVTKVSTEQYRGGTKSLKFIMADGSKTDTQRRLGLFEYEDTAPFYKSGFYMSFWVYIPSNIEDMIDYSNYNWITIGGLRWYFLDYKWNYGARCVLYYSGDYQKVRARISIDNRINSGYESPQQGIEFTPPDIFDWYHDINYGAWNQFQIYLKAKTDNTGVWQAWINDDLIGTINNQPTDPNGFLNPPQNANFFSQNNLYPHPQIMYYVHENAVGGSLYMDDFVLATEKVPNNYFVVN